LEAADDYVRDDDYWRSLCDTVFGLAPGGNVVDTWRLTEVMHCNTIPVIDDGGNYFSKFMPESLTSLFLTVSEDASDDSFQEMFRIADGLLANPSDLEQRQQSIQTEFEAYTKSWQANVWTRLQNL